MPLVLMPCESAIFSLSPVAISACPSSVFKKRAIKMMTMTENAVPTKTDGKFSGRLVRKLQEKSVFLCSNPTVALPKTRRLTD